MTANFEEERKKRCAIALCPVRSFAPPAAAAVLLADRARREQVEAHVGEVTQVLQAERAQRLLDMHRLAEQTKEMQRVMTEAREVRRRVPLLAGSRSCCRWLADCWPAAAAG